MTFASTMAQSIPRVSIPSGISHFLLEEPQMPHGGAGGSNQNPRVVQKRVCKCLTPSPLFHFLALDSCFTQPKSNIPFLGLCSETTRKRLLHMLPCLRHWISQGPSFLSVKDKWRFPNLSHLRQTGTVVQPAFAAYNRAGARFLWEMRQVYQ